MATTTTTTITDTKRRVKHYVLNEARQWIDQGTGHVSWNYNDKKRTVTLVVKSESDGIQHYFYSKFDVFRLLK